MDGIDIKARLKVLQKVASGELSPTDALNILSPPPFDEMGFATLDTQRHLRTGFPEVVFCQGKTSKQVVEIVGRLYEHHNYVMATRVEDAHLKLLRKYHPDICYHDLARVAIVGNGAPFAKHHGIVVLSAGTADLPVAEEAAVTAEAMGNKVTRLYDVGVAGIHRLLVHSDTLMEANVCVVVAGMEGALASVVGGLVGKPVIGVPTSVGYGASFQGVASLLGMLNSCAPGVSVVNIDNGFGGGFLAGLINLAIAKGKQNSVHQTNGNKKKKTTTNHIK